MKFQNSRCCFAVAMSSQSGLFYSQAHDEIHALGGVMLGSMEWLGGLRDREIAVTDFQQSLIMPALDLTIDKIKKRVFSIHGLC